jgi:hypothetical protein
MLLKVYRMVRVLITLCPDKFILLVREFTGKPVPADDMEACVEESRCLSPTMLLNLTPVLFRECFP